MIHSKRPDIAISLSAPHKQDRLTRDVCHGQRRADLVILLHEARAGRGPLSIGLSFSNMILQISESTHDGIKLGQDHPIDPSRLAPDAKGRCGKVFQTPIKLAELVHRLVTDERLADKDDFVRVVDRDEFGQCAHEGFVVLHPAGRIDQDDVVAVLFGCNERFIC